jgi:hypothetical protein
MKSIVKACALGFALLASPLPAAAEGTLTLTTLFGGGHQVLSISETSTGFEGTLVVNGIPETVTATTLFNGVQIQIGSESYVVTSSIWPQQFENWQGTLSQGRGVEFFATFKEKRAVWLYDGTIGLHDDFTGKGQVDQLDLSWAKSKLQIKSTGAGTCEGEARIGGTTTHVFTCVTTGTLTDAFFLMPKHVLWWIVNLYVK